MIAQLSIITWVTIVFMLIGMFLLLKSFSLPRNFYNFPSNTKFFPYKKNHFTLVIKSEESFLKFVEYANRSVIRSFFTNLLI